MYAVIKTGGKQYRVSPGDRIRVESLDADEGSAIDLDQVMMIGEGSSVTVGEPVIADALVSAQVLAHGRGKKVEIIKFRRRKHHRKQMGHRQNYTELEITGISGAGVSASAPAASATQTAAPKADSDSDAGAAVKFLDGPNGEADDLKQILGVGPALEEKMNSMGIFHFQQIADFTQQDIDKVNEALAFPGRIERDEWIDQAKNLANGGEPR